MIRLQQRMSDDQLQDIIRPTPTNPFNKTTVPNVSTISRWNGSPWGEKIWERFPIWVSSNEFSAAAAETYLSKKMEMEDPEYYAMDF